jgi:hypothetical protein
MIRKLLFRCAAVAFGLSLGCLFAEAGARLLAPSRRSRPALSRWVFRATRPPPYQDADYFGADFLAESLQCLRVQSVPGAGYVVPGDYRGGYIRIEAGCRATTDQPDGFAHRVLLFGGSTIFNQEVPNEQTIASCLQRLLNARPGPRWRVENHGCPSMIARQQTERLLRTPLAPGDVVVFYDGVNDVYYPVYNGNARGWLPGDGHDGGARRLSPLQRRLYPLCVRFHGHSAVARRLLERMDGRPPDNVRGDAALARNLDAAEEGYRAALVRAQQYARDRQGRFVHFLQPNLFTVARRSPYEERLRRNELKQLPGLDRAYAAGYPRLRRAVEKAGVESFDLTGTLDERAAGEEFFLDFCHANHAASERIAREVLDRLF